MELKEAYVGSRCVYRKEDGYTYGDVSVSISGETYISRTGSYTYTCTYSQVATAKDGSTKTITSGGEVEWSSNIPSSHVATLQPNGEKATLGCSYAVNISITITATVTLNGMEGSTSLGVGIYT